MSELYCLTRIKDQASSLPRPRVNGQNGWAEGNDQDRDVRNGRMNGMKHLEALTRSYSGS
jgi:hypothetical protein